MEKRNDQMARKGKKKKKKWIQITEDVLSMHFLLLWNDDHTPGGFEQHPFRISPFLLVRGPARLSWGLCSGSCKAEGECWLGCVPCWSSGSPCKLIQLVTEFTSLPCGLRPQDSAPGRHLQVPAPGPSYSTGSSRLQSQPERFSLVGAARESYSF